jgi:hypothetical protein
VFELKPVLKYGGTLKYNETISQDVTIYDDVTIDGSVTLTVAAGKTLTFENVRLQKVWDKNSIYLVDSFSHS